MLTNMKLGTKLMLGFAVVALITLILGIVGYYGAIKGEESVEEIGGVRLPSIDSLLVIKAESQRIRGNMRTLAIPGLPSQDRERQYKNLVASRNTYEKAWKVYEPLPQTEEEARLWEQFVPAWDEWRAENNAFMDLMQQYDKLGIQDPMELGRKIESFTKDHYRLVQNVLALIYMDKTFEGGEDHAACNAGQWMNGFKTDNPALAATIQAMQEPHRRFHQAIKEIKILHGQGNSNGAQQLYAMEMVPAMTQVFQHFNDMTEVVEQAIAVEIEAEEILLGSLTQKQNTAIGLLDKIVEINQDVAVREVEKAHETAIFIEILAIVAAVAGVILAMVLGFLITRGINRSLTRISQGMSEGADQVASASSQVSSSSQSMAEGASEQAASIEETSSSMEEMSSMTKKNAESAGHADSLMKETNQVVEKANTSMDELTVAMDEISKASEETSKIIKTIDEIAFQTNLLALNAAVEAARAGEAGAGFAVVADEVRNLAMRAAEAAKNTAQLIEGTVKKVGGGTELVTSTNEAFSQVADNARKVGELVAEISEASNEQSNGIDQVNIAVNEMDKVVQQNAANAEESASAAEEMNAQAEQLKDFVDELVRMVMGQKENQGFSRQPARSAASKSRHTRLPEKKTSGSSSGKMIGNKTKEVNPRQVIPMDDEDEFESF